MTALPLRDFTDAERAKLAAIEAAPAAEESVRERVAEAIYEATEAAEYHEWPDATRVVQDYIYAHADAALAVLRGPSSEAEQAVERVLALADELDDEAARHDDAEPISSDGLTRMILAAQHCREHAKRIRTAVAGPTC